MLETINSNASAALIVAAALIGIFLNVLRVWRWDEHRYHRPERYNGAIFILPLLLTAGFYALVIAEAEVQILRPLSRAAAVTHCASHIYHKVGVWKQMRSAVRNG